MKMTNREMWESIQTLLAVEEKGRLGYACSRNLRKLMGECKEYMEVRDDLLRTYGENKGGGRFSLSPEASEKITKELAQYDDIEHEVDVMKVSEAVFCAGDLTSKQMYVLAWMAEE